MTVPAKAAAFTVMGAVATAVPQPLVTEYEIVAAPTPTPDTRPPELTVATLMSLLLHTPPVAAVVNEAGVPIHRLEGPVMVPALGERLTVTDAVLKQVPIE